MGILRSEAMRHGTLVFPVDRARQVIDLIGACTNMQFEDMNAREMHRPFKKHIQRIDEMERILRFLAEEVTKVSSNVVIKNNVQSFLDHASTEYQLDDVEVQLKKLYANFVVFKENNAKLADKRNAALEETYVVKTASVSIGHAGPRTANKHAAEEFEFTASRHLLDDDHESFGRQTLGAIFSNIAGVIPQTEQDKFARALFRATRGNTFTHFQQIPQPIADTQTGQAIHKSVFVVYFQDNRSGLTSTSAMSERIRKISSAFGVSTYSWPRSIEEAEERARQLQVHVQDQDRLLQAHMQYLQQESESLLREARRGGNSVIEEWRLLCKKEKAIFATLNMFEGNMNLRASCWYPAADEERIRSILIRQSSQEQGRSGAMLVSDRTPPQRRPPTFIRRNEFSGVFQDLVDTYGLPRYGEANPTLFTIVTFPFLFGIMYGDVGHGSLLLAFGLWTVWNSAALRYTAAPLYAARYMLVMMGFFAVYAGFIYNDLFSVGLTIFGSRWTAGAKVGDTVTFEPLYDTTNSGGAGPYPFGVDPAWHGANNELIFMNSLKMKLSVIFGVVQMIVGLVLRFSNAIYERNTVDLLCECVPMMVFMVCFFGFMDYMILYKWVTPLENPPSIINSLIAMGMWQDDPNPMFSMGVVRLLMTLSMLTVPVMLIPKPILLALQNAAKHRNRRSTSSRQLRASDEETFSLCANGEANIKEHEEEEEFEIGEVVIHQVIETIEYVLGTVSHTASYLRLWALSLAHQQLSLVFFQKTILGAMTVSLPWNVIAIFLAFAVWLGITLAILCGMDVLECFLHTLRLHWVEFQSKFYKADGYAFIPYRHSTILEEEE